ncbi:MAG: 4-hydroxythreonine-4-phosphate dehydrogenase PdxA [Acidobacteria bacterium]|nr:4-hydroxythreonine-4-phosphate dehydrogenase PdxA [Acidobacteriota bacterium]
MRRVRVGITVGDPAGIGPEIAEKARQDARVQAVCEPVIYGPASLAGVRAGEESAAGGRAAYDTLVRAVDAARRGEIDAIATAPLSKRAFALAGLPWKGHTDLLAHLCGVEHVRMLFYAAGTEGAGGHAPLCVTLVTVHVPLAEVPRLISTPEVTRTIVMTADWLRVLGTTAPRVALAGLNPHAGEAGLLGHEDEDVLRPAVAEARGQGVDASGPWPADTVFVRAARGEFDAVVACYHDQGLIPVKLLAFGDAVNVTIGLPIIRTSVDHGTAFDIAGRDIADPGSMIAAVRLAARLAEARA